MQIGVEEAVDHRLAEEGADEDRGKRIAIVAGRDQRLAVVELDSVEPFEGEHAPGGSAPVDLRHIIGGLGDHVLAKLRSRSCFALEVQLASGPLLELRDDQPRPQALKLAAHRLDVRRGPFVGLDRLADFLFDAGPEHLHGDDAALGGHRLVDLRDGGGADGLGIEALVELLERGIEGGLDDLA